MTIQLAIKNLRELGRLPCSENIDPSTVEKYEGLLTKTKRPISDEEACVLVQVLGPDDCFGLAWTLVHLIETAPGWPIECCLEKLPTTWVSIMKQRAGIQRFAC